MLPESQYNKEISKSVVEDCIYFASNSGLYMGSAFIPPKKISDRADILCLTAWGKKLFAGTKDGEILLPRRNKVTKKRYGPIHGFVRAEELYDVSPRAGAYMIHETRKPCSSSQEFWSAPSPHVYWYAGQFVALDDNKLVDLTGKPFVYTDDPIHHAVQVFSRVWTVQNNLVKGPLGENMAELPSDADSILYHDDRLYYLRGAGLEEMMLDTHERKQLFPDHIINCFTVTKCNVKRQIGR